MGVDMSENLKKFREFVEAHPQIKNVVKNKLSIKWNKPKVIPNIPNGIEITKNSFITFLFNFSFSLKINLYF